MEKAASVLSISSNRGQRPCVDPGNYPCNVPMQESGFFVLTQSHQYKIKLISGYFSMYVGGI